ncbi:SE1832 family protein [Bacillus dakarensis]|uniref:SE1832 family protein n=1 Tax=Robertmurraya dakarensis TaxID=1926278 RepID=UPI00192A5A00|nr:SE1832 family protein [Bacillus dakarensis]
MTKFEINSKIQELKSEYIRLQHDLEKLEFVQGNLSPLEKQITEIEEELKRLYKQLETV